MGGGSLRAHKKLLALLASPCSRANQFAPDISPCRRRSRCLGGLCTVSEEPASAAAASAAVCSASSDGGRPFRAPFPGATRHALVTGNSGQSKLATCAGRERPKSCRARVLFPAGGGIAGADGAGRRLHSSFHRVSGGRRRGYDRTATETPCQVVGSHRLWPPAAPQLHVTASDEMAYLRSPAGRQITAPGRAARPSDQAARLVGAGVT